MHYIQYIHTYMKVRMKSWPFWGTWYLLFVDLGLNMTSSPDLHVIIMYV